MKRRPAIWPALAVCALLSACAAEELGPQFREISEAESGLVFYGPGLGGGYRQFLAGQDARFVNRTLGVYGPRRGEFPFAQIILMETPPNMHFTKAPSPKAMFEMWDWFEGRTITTGQAGSAVNVIGRADYAVATADGVACMAWTQPFGISHDGGVGTRLLAGFYCKGKAPMMAAAEAESVVKALGHRKVGLPDKPTGWQGS